MLEFFSASTRMANPQRAIAECLEVALGTENQDCDLIIINASMGHPLGDLIAQTRIQCPGARVVAASCAGVVGREGVSESMKDVALMAIRGKEFAVAYVDGLFGHNSFDKGVELAEALQQANPAVTMAYLVASGIDIANDRLIAGFESIMGRELTLFGATSSDNNRALTSHQAVDDQIFTHAAFVVGFADPTLEVLTRASHGFVAAGEPLVVTRAEGNRIIALNGKPAWPEYLARLGLAENATLADTGPIGALAEALAPEAAHDYGNDHILRAILKCDADGSMAYPVSCCEGTRLWLTRRDEERIFRDMERMLDLMQAKAGHRKPIAVFQADCGARGRLLFNRVMKEELIQRLQYPFSREGLPPPWLGIYGFGEYARLAGVNCFHNYTTAIAALYRK